MEYSDESNVKNLTTDSEITLYAKWGTFNKIYLPNAILSGYSLLGWYTESGEFKGAAGEEYQPTGNTTLYAHWSARSFIVTFNPNGGAVEWASKSVVFNEPYGELPVPSHTEFAFKGWFTQEWGGIQVDSSTTMTIPRDHMLYAHWKNGKIALTFDPDGGYLSDDDDYVRIY